MQTKNIISNNHCQRLKELNEMIRLHKLQAKCETFKTEIQSLVTERSQCFENREKITERLLSIQEDLKAARKEESFWQTKLEDAKSSSIEDKIEDLQNTCILLGFQISKCQSDNGGFYITLQYRDICYVSYSEKDQIFYLEEVYPQHSNFPKIKQFFESSQDLRGFLTCMRKFFDFAIQTKENMQI